MRCSNNVAPGAGRSRRLHLPSTPHAPGHFPACCACKRCIIAGIIGALGVPYACLQRCNSPLGRLCWEQKRLAHGVAANFLMDFQRCDPCSANVCRISVAAIKYCKTLRHHARCGLAASQCCCTPPKRLAHKVAANPQLKNPGALGHSHNPAQLPARALLFLIFPNVSKPQGAALWLWGPRLAPMGKNA